VQLHIHGEQQYDGFTDLLPLPTVILIRKALGGMTMTCLITLSPIFGLPI
jgi:hypothetical protein